MTVMSQTFQISRDIHVEIWKIPRGFFKFLENDPIRGPNTPFEAEFSEIFKFRNNIENQSLLPQKPSRNGNWMWASLHAGVSRRSLKVKIVYQHQKYFGGNVILGAVSDTGKAR